MVTQLTYWECCPGLWLQASDPRAAPTSTSQAVYSWGQTGGGSFLFLFRWCLMSPVFSNWKIHSYYLFTENFQIKKIFKNTKAEDERDLDATVSCLALPPCSSEVILEAVRSMSYSCRWLAGGLEKLADSHLTPFSWYAFLLVWATWYTGNQKTPLPHSKVLILFFLKRYF